MAKRKYRPYSTRKQQKSRGMRNIALVLIVLTTAVIIFIQANKTKPSSETESTTNKNPREVVLDDIRPEKTKPSETPEEAVKPKVKVPKPAPISTPAKPPEENKPEPPVSKPPVESETSPISVTKDAVNSQISPQAKELINQAVELSDEQGKIIPARDLLSEALKLNLSLSVRAAVKARLAKMADTWLFGSEVYAEDALTGYYLVPPGDNFENIAKLHKVPYEILLRMNGIIRPELLRAGQKIKVIHGPFNAVVHKSTFTMDLYLQTKYIKSYRVGLGKDTFDTPTGRWRVAAGGKLIKPSWTDPDTGRTYDGTDPDYPLGSRWIALDGLDGDAKGRTGFAIHGTKDEKTIGTRSSRGCIRLYNGDVIEIYDLLYGGVSEVLVVK